MKCFLIAAPNPALARALASVQHSQKRPRSEKKPIPNESKDDKYFERRKRNNCAAKKSRDARKSREDEIAIRASYLEKENAVLRAQVATLREEANTLRQMLLQKRSRPWWACRVCRVYEQSPLYSRTGLPYTGSNLRGFQYLLLVYMLFESNIFIR